MRTHESSFCKLRWQSGWLIVPLGTIVGQTCPNKITGGTKMRKLLASASIAAIAAALLSAGAYAQEGTVAKAVGGYTFEEAAKEKPETKNFHSADGHLTFAIITHTAGNGF